MNIPVPPRGYWAKLRAGEKVEKTPLPPTDGVIEKTGTRTFEVANVTDTQLQTLSFLSKSQIEELLHATQQIKMPAENIHLHKKIIAYKSKIKN